MTKTLDVPLDGPPVPRVPHVLEHRCTLSGLMLHALPPGEVEIAFRLESYILDVNLNAVAHEIAVDSDRLRPRIWPGDSCALAPPGTDYRMRTTNTLWGALIEVEPERAGALFAEGLDGRDLPARFMDYTPAPQVAHLGRLLIAHLREPHLNRLYAEGLGLAALGLALDGGGAGALAAVSTAGLDARLARAVDHAEAHLGEALSVAELAGAAAMSPSHFARAFRAATGEPVWAFVQRRRCERARDLLLATRLPLAEVAHQTGFASQSHLTTSLRGRYGATPGDLRRGGGP